MNNSESGIVKLYIKNMVCPRCIAAVREALTESGAEVMSVTLGEAEIVGEPDDGRKREIAARLEKAGFELLEDRRSRIISSVKNGIVELIYAHEVMPEVNLSEYLSDRLHLEYKYISTLFSETEGRSIEKYFIAQKIERVKELLIYDELTLGQIAFRLGYSSVAHLSMQFKRETGIAPSVYKRSGVRNRRSLDEL